MTTQYQKRRRGGGRQLNVWFEGDTLERIKTASAADGRTMSGWARVVLLDELDRLDLLDQQAEGGGSLGFSNALWRRLRSDRA